MTVAARVRPARGGLARAVIPAGLATAVLLGLLVGRASTTPAVATRAALVLVVATMVLALAGVRRALLTIVVLDIAFAWDVNLHYQDDAAAIGAIGGLSISATTVALAFLYGLALAERMVRSGAGIRLRPAAIPIAYVALTAFSALWASDQLLSVFEIALLLQTLLLFIYVISFVRDVRQIELLTTVLTVALLVESILIIASWLQIASPIPGVKLRVDTLSGPTRAGGTVGSPNTAAAFVASLLPLATALMIASRRRAERVVAAAAAGAGVIALALTGSRGGASGFVVSMLAFVFVGVRRGWIRPRAVVVGTAVLLVALIPVSGVLLARTESDAGAAESRQPLNQLALQTIEKNPLLGVGANNVGPEFQRTAGPEYSGDWIYTVHNKYLLVAAEAGVAALVAFLAFLVSTLRRGRRAVVGHAPRMSAVAAGLTCGVVAQMVHMTVDLFQSRPQVQLLWLIAAMLVVMSEQQRQQGRQHRQTELVA